MEDQKADDLLGLYISLPDTPDRPRKNDRSLARRLAQDNDWQSLETALLLGQARRLKRNPKAEPLQPIRSLHYFLPVLEEVRRTDVPQDYLSYLRRVCTNT